MHALLALFEPYLQAAAATSICCCWLSIPQLITSITRRSLTIFVVHTDMARAITGTEEGVVLNQDVWYEMKPLLDHLRKHFLLQSE